MMVLAIPTEFSSHFYVVITDIKTYLLMVLEFDTHRGRDNWSTPVAGRIKTFWRPPTHRCHWEQRTLSSTYFYTVISILGLAAIHDSVLCFQPLIFSVPSRQYGINNICQIDFSYRSTLPPLISFPLCVSLCSQPAPCSIHIYSFKKF
jgi:hypothetical protein